VGSPARISAPLFGEGEWQREWNGVVDGAEEPDDDDGDDEAAFDDGDGTFDDDGGGGDAAIAVTPSISTRNRGRCVSGVREAVVFRTGAWTDGGFEC